MGLSLNNAVKLGCGLSGLGDVEMGIDKTSRCGWGEKMC